MRMSFRLAVSEGRVLCPVRNAEIDVDQCVSCRAFRGNRNGNLRTGVITCKNEMADVLPTLNPQSLYWPSR
jgi:hypothetical protein